MSNKPQIYFNPKTSLGIMSDSTLSSGNNLWLISNNVPIHDISFAISDVPHFTLFTRHEP